MVEGLAVVHEAVDVRQAEGEETHAVSGPVVPAKLLSGDLRDGVHGVIAGHGRLARHVVGQFYHLSEITGVIGDGLGVQHSIGSCGARILKYVQRAHDIGIHVTAWIVAFHVGRQSSSEVDDGIYVLLGQGG